MIDVQPEDNIYSIKKAVEERTSFPAEFIRLILYGKILVDDSTARDFNFQEKSILVFSPKFPSDEWPLFRHLIERGIAESRDSIVQMANANAVSAAIATTAEYASTLHSDTISETLRSQLEECSRSRLGLISAELSANPLAITFEMTPPSQFPISIDLKIRMDFDDKTFPLEPPIVGIIEPAGWFSDDFCKRRPH